MKELNETQDTLKVESYSNVIYVHIEQMSSLLSSFEELLLK